MKKVIVYLLSAFLICFCQLSVSATTDTDQTMAPSTDQSTNSATGATDTTSTNGTTTTTDTTATTGTSDTTNMTGTTTSTGSTSMNDKVTITGVPQATYTTVESHDNVYALPETVEPVSGYYFLNIDSSDKVCSLHKVKKISKKATSKKVTVTVKTKKEVLYCYDKDYFNFQ